MMIDENSNEWRELIFSQREGKAPLPEALQVGKLTTKFRNQVWYVIERNIAEHECLKEVEEFARVDYIEAGEEPSYWGFDESPAGIFWQKLTYSYQIDLLEIPHDEIKIANPGEVRQWLKDMIIEGEAHQVMTLLEYMLRLPNIREKLANDIEQCFKFAPYWIDRSNESPCIFPATSKEMKENTKRALDNINQSALTRAKSHLRKAAQELNNKNFADSIRESIHAVESTARQIAPESLKTLDPALDSLLLIPFGFFSEKRLLAANLSERKQ